MANPSEFHIKRVDDATIFRLFKSAQNAGEKTLQRVIDAEIELKGRNHQISTSYSSSLPWTITEDDLSQSPPGEYAIGRASLSFVSKTVDRQQQRQDSVTFELVRGTDGGVTDTFRISSSNQYHSMNGSGEQTVQRSIHKSLSTLLQPVAPEDGGLVPTLTNLSQAFDTSYQRIASELSTAVAAVSKERAEQITEFQNERRKLREEMLEEREELLATARKTLDTERLELETLEKEIAEERLKLEISSHKDARRKQFDGLQKDLLESLNAPAVDKGLRTMRWAVFIALIAAGCAAGFFAFLSFDIATWEAAIPSSAVDRFSTVMMLVLRTVVLTVASLGAFLGAAAWMRYFYNRDLQTQEDMRRFRNDMARASWVMEAALEIRKEHDEEIPPEWISGVTEGLFSANKKESLEEGAQALAALMGLSAGANIGPNGMEVQLSRKGRKAIANAAGDT
ncbi:hypothetical protein [Tateyamaria sp. syn59]|uniref:hypothetical protein n=1 Tax=Tateyamaria sp. syn59 TaxID=2576942 RepID=UPI0011BD93F7|nr:hypothetical protein [Tateyamaria sp. syn59]